MGITKKYSSYEKSVLDVRETLWYNLIKKLLEEFK